MAFRTVGEAVVQNGIMIEANGDGALALAVIRGQTCSI
jgi:hypothetical protein